MIAQNSIKEESDSDDERKSDDSYFNQNKNKNSLVFMNQ